MKLVHKAKNLCLKRCFFAIQIINVFVRTRMGDIALLCLFLLGFAQTKKCIEKDGWKCTKNPTPVIIFGTVIFSFKARKIQASFFEVSQRNGEQAFCDVDVMSWSELSSEEFEKTYRNKKPVLLT